LNLGVQDAFNLGWKLAQVVKGISPEALLDTYHAERHPAGAQTLRLTMALTALARGDERTEALRDVVNDMFQIPEARKRYGGLLSGFAVHYDLGPGHPLLGRRMPDLEVTTDAGRQRVFGLLHDARPVLLSFQPGLARRGPDHVKWVDARYDGAWELPVVGPVNAPTAVLVRPDGHVAWVGEGTDDGLYTALTTWFAAPPD